MRWPNIAWLGVELDARTIADLYRVADGALSFEELTEDLQRWGRSGELSDNARPVKEVLGGRFTARFISLCKWPTSAAPSRAG